MIGLQIDSDGSYVIADESLSPLPSKREVYIPLTNQELLTFFVQFSQEVADNEALAVALTELYEEDDRLKDSAILGKMLATAFNDIFSDTGKQEFCKYILVALAKG